MTSRKNIALNALRRNEQELKDIGVSKIGIFGSVARGEDSENSDIDILVQFSPECHKFKNFNRLCDLLDGVFEEQYDLVTVEGLSPYLGVKILEEVVYAALAT